MRAQSTKLYKTFVKGLITEASPLTYPEDTSLDEDNCLIFSKGNRTRRLGADFENNYTYSPFEVADLSNTPVVEYSWTSVGNIATTSFLCTQIGGTIYFFDLYSTPVSGSVKGFSIDLTAYAASGATSIEMSPVQMTSGKGYLFVAGEKITPLIVEYSASSDSITVTPVTIHIRDFDGVDDDLAVDEEPTTLSTTHNYNLQNQGWLTQTPTTVTSITLFARQRTVTKTVTNDTIAKYKTIVGTYPGNNKQWFLGKTEIENKNYQPGDFDPLFLNKVFVGNGRAPRGHFIVDAFNKDRAAVSGIAGLASDVKTYRPSAVAFFSGRVWWFARSGVYFSQILDKKEKAGECYQEADPTAEDINGLIATDGGYIPIPAADEIVRGVEIGNGVIAFARNGVWLVTGSDKGFSAVEYQVTKITGVGTDSPYSIVTADTSVFWWSKTGIQQITQSAGSFGPIPGAYKTENISQQTVDTLFKSIGADARRFVKGVYDNATNTIYWAYRASGGTFDFGYNRFLNLDLTIGAFFPWSLSSGSYPHICGLFLTPELNLLSNAADVVASGSNVTNTVGSQVVAQSTALSAKANFTSFLCAAPVGGTYRFTIGAFQNDDFVDWEKFNGTGLTYSSFVESGYEILADAYRRKQMPYLTVFFRQTEENFVADGADYTTDKPSSCYLTVKWDWTSSGDTGKWSTKRQVYKHRRIPFVNPLNLAFNTGTNVVYTKNKIRGMGRSLQFRLETDERGKNFDCLGWQATYSGSTVA